MPCVSATKVDKRVIQFIITLIILTTVFVPLILHIFKEDKRGVLMIGGIGHRAEFSLEFYSPFKKNSTLLDISLPAVRSNHVSAVLPDGRILVAGGESDQTLIIDLVSKCITTGPRMITLRYEPGAATHNGKVCGGTVDTNTPTNNCEIFSDFQWLSMNPMEVRRSSPALVIVKDDLFVFGGTIDQEDPVEKYSTSKSVWFALAPMNLSRYALAAAEFDGNAVVCGGYLDRFRSVLINECQRYVLDEDRWETFPSMIFGRAEFALLNIDGILYALGGALKFKGRGLVERFDGRIGEWRIYGELMAKRRRTSGVVVTL